MSREIVDSRGGDDPGTSLKRVIGPKLLLLFILGDILGAGVYAVTGDIATKVGGLAWMPFLIAFGIAGLTALSYLELVTKYPLAAGAAFYTHRAFRLQFLSFMVAFAVVSSGITSAATSARLLSTNLLIGLDAILGDAGVGLIDIPSGGVGGTATSLLFLVLLALINLWGVSQSLMFNVVLTIVEMLALAIVIAAGLWVVGRGEGDVSRLTDFESAGDANALVAVTVATAIAFFAMVGFEDAVNMAEETTDPQRSFPRSLVVGVGVAAAIYMLVAAAVVTVLGPDQIAETADSEAGVLLAVVERGLPGLPLDTIFPFMTVFAVANTALINMLMASRLVYGMARQDVLPRALGRVLPGRGSPWAAIVLTTLLALLLVVVVGQLSEGAVVTLAGTTSLLLLGVFGIVNVAALVLRRDTSTEGVFRSPTAIPVVAAGACLFLAGPWARERSDWIQYEIAAGMLVVGLALWLLAWTFNRTDRRAGP